MMDNHLFPLTAGMDNFVRKIWYSKAGPAGPIFYLETSVDVQELLAEAKRMGAPVLAFVLKASARALRKYPQMYNYCFGGKMVFGGETIRISAAHELPDGTAASYTYSASEGKGIDEISKEISRALEILSQAASSPPGLLLRVADRFPRLMYFLQRLTGSYDRQIMRHTAPFFITAINLPGIQRTIFQPFSSPGLIFNRACDGKAVLGISLSHGYGNARQVGTFLNAIREGLEQPRGLV